MADPATELAREFLEFNKYIVIKQTKFHKNKKLKGTPGDIDIIAISPKKCKLEGFTLKGIVVAEVKNWNVKTKAHFNDIYSDKFKFINNDKIGWKQLKKYISSKKFDRVLFCGATTNAVYKYAEKKGVRIITSGFIIKYFCKHYTKYRKKTYYSEAYNFSLIRTIMNHLNKFGTFKDKLTLKDFVWINHEEDAKYTNQFNERNGKFMADFLFYDEEQLRKLIEDKSEWFFNESLKTFKKGKKQQIIRKVEKYFKNKQNAPSP
ncbi:hypothetical protein HY637_03555 [Candidatus Woesearchaeota archaeon]|nr:hypothetical protein [Candidatus Woesearchaeota archaeon]